VAIWDATNETPADIFGDEIIPAVRMLDLSNRPWENSWNAPQGPNDPMECHPYLTIVYKGRPLSFDVTQLEQMDGSPAPTNPEVAITGHARILNEYGWLWLLRDGTPTPVSKPVYDKLLGPDATGEERLEFNAYLLAGETEFWRAHRQFAAVLHFVYLTSNYPGVYTTDHFKDVESLMLNPHFEDYMRQAFKPLGVYINFWHPTLEAGSKQRFYVMMINDEYTDAKGNLTLALEPENGASLEQCDRPFFIPGLGQQTYKFDLELPETTGKFVLKAAAFRDGSDYQDPTVSRRKVSLVKKPS